jgi:hypothetical protein
MLRKMKVVLAGLLLLGCLGCGGQDSDGAQFAIYHLEAAIGRPGDEGDLRCGPPRIVCPGVVRQPPPRAFRYPVTADPALTGAGIERSSVRQATDPETGAALVLVDLNAEGTEAFAAVTREAARVGGRDQMWHHVAVVVGDEIVAFPEIDYDDYPDGMTNAPGIQIAAVSAADARELVRRLRDGD